MSNNKTKQFLLIFFGVLAIAALVVYKGTGLWSGEVRDTEELVDAEFEREAARMRAESVQSVEDSAPSEADLEFRREAAKMISGSVDPL